MIYPPDGGFAERVLAFGALTSLAAGLALQGVKELGASPVAK